MKLIALMLLTIVACDPDDPAVDQPLYADDWETSFLQVRGCRSSPDHDLEYVSLWIDPASQARFEECVKPGGTCTGEFDAGATFLKPQYADPACTQLVRISAAKKDTSFTTSGGWRWQEVLYEGGQAEVSQDGALVRCYGCHVTPTSCEGAFDTRCYMDE